MEIAYHPEVRGDVLAILRYYRTVSRALSDEFHQELQSTMKRAAENPLRFHSVDKGFRRANLTRFPYHILYETGTDPFV